MAESIFTFHVNTCPICSKKHTYHFVVRTLPIFGGKSDDEGSSQEYTVLVNCLTDDIPYQVTIAVPRTKNQKIVKLEQKSHE
jgi:hypothetical protein